MSIIPIGCTNISNGSYIQAPANEANFKNLMMSILSLLRLPSSSGVRNASIASLSDSLLGENADGAQ